MKKKILALLLAFVMVMGMLPMAALAEEVTAPTDDEKTQMVTSATNAGMTVSDAAKAYLVKQNATNAYSSITKGECTLYFSSFMNGTLAVAKASEGTKITLNSNISVAYEDTWTNFEIDTNGHCFIVKKTDDSNVGKLTLAGDSTKIYSNSDAQVALFEVIDGGTLTIQAGEYTSKYAELIKAWGTVNIEDGTFTTTSKAPAGKALAMLQAFGKDGDKDAHGHIIMTGGTIDATGTKNETTNDYHHPICAMYGGSLTLGTKGKGAEGPTIKGSYLAIGGNNTMAPVTVTINSGTYTTCALAGGDTPNKFDSVIYATSYGTYTINGGKFEPVSGGRAISIPYKNTAVTMNVTDGDFYGGIYMGTEDGTGTEDEEGFGTPNLTISGGSYSDAVDPKFLDAKLPYQVQTASGDTPYSYYASAAEAMTAAGTSGTVVKVSKDGSGSTPVYKITFDLNCDGAESVDPVYAEGTPVANWPTDPTRSGYTFVGWYENEDGTGTAMTADSSYSANTTLHAQWKKNPYTITFHPNNGTWTDGTTEAKTATTGDGDKLAAGDIPADLKRDGYTFVGWNTEADGSGDAKNPASETFTAATTLYAQWTQNTPDTPDPYKVTFDANGGTWADGTGKKEVPTDADGKLTVPEDPTLVGSNFVGWFTDAQNGTQVTAVANQTYTVESDTTLFAHWKAAETTTGYTVTFDANGGTWTDGKSSQEVKTDADGKLTVPENPTREGHGFGGWYTDANSGNRVTAVANQTYTVESDTTLFAHWTPVSSGGDTPSTPDYSGGTSNTTTTTTTKNDDGSTTTKTENKTTGTVTETTKKTDGSTTVVETKKDGTVTTTDTDKDGNKSTTVAKPDGSSETKVAQKDGSTSTTTVDTAGQVKAEVTLSNKALETEDNAPVALPMPQVPVTTVRETAPTVTVSLPSGSKDVKVEIPVENVTPGTVAVIVKADGTEEVIKTSLTTENGIAVALSDGDTVKIVDNSKTFDDMENHWGTEAVDFASSRELFNGTSDTTFSPDTDMTRGMLVTVLARFDGADTAGGDVWYEKGVEWALENNVSDGTDPEASITREQMITMIWRYAGSPAVTGSALGSFADADSVSSYAADAMNWAVSVGLINGVSPDTLAPQNGATRAQVATLLMRYVELLAAQ